MQFAKTTVALLLPLLAFSSPTPSNTALESRDSIGVDLGTLKDLQQRLYDAQGQITSIVDNIVGTSNSVLNQWSGSAAESFRAALDGYSSDQTKALSELEDLASAVGASADSFNEAESTNRELWG